MEKSTEGTKKSPDGQTIARAYRPELLPEAMDELPNEPHLPTPIKSIHYPLGDTINK